MADINDILSNLNSRYEEVTDLVPDKVFFVDDFDYAKNEYGQSYDNSPLGSQLYLLSSGKYIWVGIDGANDDAKNVRRYNSDFTLDETFVCPDFDNSDNGYVRSVVEQSNGKIVVVGHFTNMSGYNYIMRLNTDGSIDDTFHSGGFNERALVIRSLGDGSLLVGGRFTSYDGTSVHRLVKLDSDGVLDTVFSGHVTFNNTVHEIFVDSSTGKIYVGGQFTNSMVRLNSDGTSDGTFSVSLNNRVTSIKKDASGNLVVGGWFDNHGPRVVRMDNTGTIDSSFEPEGTGLNKPNGSVQTLAIQADGKIVVGGWFDEYNEERQGNIIRLNTDGSRDASFVTGYGFNENSDWEGSRIQNILINDGKILCVGSMTAYDHWGLYGFASLDSDGSLNPERLFRYVSNGIGDGNNDMYDGGNFINTNLTQLFDDVRGNGADAELNIPNTHSAAQDESIFEDEGEPSYYPVMDGVVMSGDEYFGEGSSYFTNMYPGMFVMVATNVDIEEFSITGGLGSDGSTQNASSVIVVHEGSTYTVFVKVNREGDGGESGADPSVNHLIIVPGEQDGLTHLINESNDYDDDCVQGLTGRGSIAYLLVARMDSQYLSDSDAEAVALKFLDVVGGLSGSQTYSATGGGIYDLSPQFVRQVGEGSLDTAIVEVDGERVSLQRTGYYEVVNSQGGRKVVEVADGETWNDVPVTPEATDNPNGHPTFGANDVPSVTEQVIPAGNPLAR
ncbi:hypothetical protein EBT16_01090 [bacterium]|nr:hypothetical protein [bacterium]